MDNQFLDVESHESKPKHQSNIRLISIRVLQKIVENGYKSSKKPFFYYCKETVDRELNRKINNKKFRGFNFTKSLKKS